MLHQYAMFSMVHRVAVQLHVFMIETLQLHTSSVEETAQW